MDIDPTTEAVKDRPACWFYDRPMQESREISERTRVVSTGCACAVAIGVTCFVHPTISYLEVAPFGIYITVQLCTLALVCYSASVINFKSISRLAFFVLAATLMTWLFGTGFIELLSMGNVSD